ncbi:phage virion morphogenesis protein [Ruegeria sediminis]|uniref:Phage virion morphogenesis protein n=1 Tax=Ruegeria sediminis TaxID=2583820 RepID=A0ABY2X446_9RHOB|nr:phage virion morphogenesis protein [Ruegeria sediminis]TMV09825.1 phage virion morphogenesis protein [Ruegeria sediminis]
MYTLQINDDDLTPALMRLRDGVSNMTPLMQDLGEILVNSTQERMQRGEQPDGAPFAPRSETTLKEYAERGFRFGPQPLWGTGEMRQQLAYEAGSDYVSWGSNAIQAAVMQFGAKKGAFGTYQGKGFGDSTPTISIPWGDIPARPYLGVSEDDRIAIVAEIEDWLSDIADGRD